jgi:hypothetical protein
MKPVWVVLLIPSLFLVAGCSGEPTLKLEPPDVRYGRAIKNQVLSFVRDARQNPRMAGQGIEGLLETFESYREQGVEVHKDIFSKLEAKCKEIQAAANSGAPINQKLQELEELANKLPGEVQLQTPEYE